jgi:hypothetical protein
MRERAAAQELAAKEESLARDQELLKEQLQQRHEEALRRQELQARETEAGLLARAAELEASVAGLQRDAAAAGLAAAALEAEKAALLGRLDQAVRDGETIKGKSAVPTDAKREPVHACDARSAIRLWIARRGRFRMCGILPSRAWQIRSAFCFSSRSRAWVVHPMPASRSPIFNPKLRHSVRGPRASAGPCWMARAGCIVA